MFWFRDWSSPRLSMCLLTQNRPSGPVGREALSPFGSQDRRPGRAWTTCSELQADDGGARVQTRALARRPGLMASARLLGWTSLRAVGAVASSELGCRVSVAHLPGSWLWLYGGLFKTYIMLEQILWHELQNLHSCFWKTLRLGDISG